jgi:hypothetical protein
MGWKPRGQDAHRDEHAAALSNVAVWGQVRIAKRAS